MKLGLLLFSGVPASGKTTLAETLKNNFNHYRGDDYNFIHICYDVLIPIQDDICELKYKVARNGVLEKVDNLLIALKNKNNTLCPAEFRNQFESIKSFEASIVLIIDDNLYFRSMRYSLFQIAKKHGIGFCQVFFNCSLDDALKKNSLREPGCIIPPNVIENMYNKIEPPNCDNFWEKYSLTINAFSNINEFCDKLFGVLNDSLNNYFYEKEDNWEVRELSLLQCKKSVLHQADIALRKIINCKIKEFRNQNSKEQFSEYCAQLNARKPQILFDLKVGNICLPGEILDEINEQFEEKYKLINFLNSYL